MLNDTLSNQSILLKCFSNAPIVIIDRIIGYFCISLCITFIISTHIRAQQASINDLNISVRDNQLYVKCLIKHNFIDEQMQQTLSSGMSSTFNFQINLKYINGSIIKNPLKEVVIRYDIWEKRYLLFIAEEIHQFSSFKNFESFLLDSLEFKVGSIKGIADKKPLRVILFFSPQKISSSQKEKLNYWLTGNTDTKESTPGLDRESGFSIDLSELFSLFLSDKPETHLQQYKTDPFTIEKLRKNEKPAQ